MDATHIALFCIAAAFAVYLFVQVRPAFSPRRRALHGELRLPAREPSRELRAAAPSRSPTPADRSTREPLGGSVGLFLRARADPGARPSAAWWLPSVRVRLLASILERRMGASVEPEERPAFVAMASAAAPLRRPAAPALHAKLMTRLIAHEEAALTHSADRPEPSG
jgi:hypothetical protein